MRFTPPICNPAIQLLMAISRFLLCSLILLGVSGTGIGTALRNEGVNMGAQLLAAKLVVRTAYFHVSTDNSSFDTLLKLSQSPAGTVGVNRFVQIMVKHGAEVTKACSDLRQALADATTAQISADDSKLQGACGSVAKLESAGQLWDQNEAFIRENLPAAVAYLDASSDQILQECREMLAADKGICADVDVEDE